jgi:hypothetical protein
MFGVMALVDFYHCVNYTGSLVLSLYGFFLFASFDRAYFKNGLRAIHLEHK